MDWAALSNFVEHQLDAKLRLAIPSGWRPKVFEAEGAEAAPLHVRPMKQLDGTYLLRCFYHHYREEIIREISERPEYAGKPAKRMDAIMQFTTLCHPREVNSQGKLVVPEALVKAANLPVPGKVVLLLNEGFFFDIMSRTTFEAVMAVRAAREPEFSDLF